MSECIFVRHGQASFWSTNYDELSPLGIQQAERLGHYLRENHLIPDQIWTGPLKRQIHTAEIIARILSLPSGEIKMVEDLSEHQGPQVVKAALPRLIENRDPIIELVNKPYKNKEEQLANYLPIYEQVTKRWAHGEFDQLGFESWPDFLKRCSSVIDTLHQSNAGLSICVSSGGPVSAAAGHVLGLPSETILHLAWRMYNTGIVDYHIDPYQGPLLKGYNQLPHLPDKKWHTLV